MTHSLTETILIVVVVCAAIGVATAILAWLMSMAVWAWEGGPPEQVVDPTDGEQDAKAEGV